MKKQSNPLNLDDTVEKIGAIIEEFNASMAQHLPMLEQEVNGIIARKSRDEKEIEQLLDTLLSLQYAGIGEYLFIRLLEYYKMVNAEYAADYWQSFDEIDD